MALHGSLSDHVTSMEFFFKDVSVAWDGSERLTLEISTHANMTYKTAKDPAKKIPLSHIYGSISHVKITFTVN